MKRFNICCAALLGAAILLSACSGRKSTVGAPASGDVTPVPLATVLSAPADYDGKQVVLRGIVTAQCAALCDFTYSEGGDPVTVYMDADKAPRMQAGQPVRVTALVHKGEEKVVFTAVGVEVLPKGGAP